MAQTKAELNKVLEDRFQIIFFPAAMTNWNAVMCNDVAAQAKATTIVSILAIKAGMDPHRADRELLAEQDRCCQIVGKWERKPCDQADLQRQTASLARAQAIIEELIDKRDAAP